MKSNQPTVLVLTSYKWDHCLETFGRCYPFETACRDARTYWAENHLQADYNTEVHHTPVEVTRETIRSLYPLVPSTEREEQEKGLLQTLGRYYALEAIRTGFVGVPEGTPQESFEADISELDLGFLIDCLDRECRIKDGTALSDEERKIFYEAYRSTLFLESDCI